MLLLLFHCSSYLGLAPMVKAGLLSFPLSLPYLKEPLPIWIRIMIAKSFPRQLIVLGPNGLTRFQWQQLLGTEATIPVLFGLLALPALCLHHQPPPRVLLTTPLDTLAGCPLRSLDLGSPRIHKVPECPSGRNLPWEEFTLLLLAQ